MRVLTSLSFCCLLFSVAVVGFGFSGLPDEPTDDGGVDSEEVDVFDITVEYEDESTSPDQPEEVDVSDVTVDDTLSEDENTSPDQEVSPVPLTEDPVSEQIRRISEQSVSEELGSGFNVDLILGYTDHGVDAIVPEHFFSGHIASQKVSISHSSGFRLAVENVTSIKGGSFSDLGDRTILSAEVLRTFGRFYGAIQHRWVHVNYRMDEFFLYGDRHRTHIQSGISLGPLQPYVLVSSDMPAYTPIQKMACYGGAGIDMNIPIGSLRTEINFGASVVGSLFWYNQSPRTMYRLHADFVTTVGRISFNPEITFLTDAFNGDSVLVSSVKIGF